MLFIYNCFRHFIRISMLCLLVSKLFKICHLNLKYQNVYGWNILLHKYLSASNKTILKEVSFKCLCYSAICVISHVSYCTYWLKQTCLARFLLLFLSQDSYWHERETPLTAIAHFLWHRWDCNMQAYLHCVIKFAQVSRITYLLKLLHVAFVQFHNVTPQHKIIKMFLTCNFLGVWVCYLTFWFWFLKDFLHQSALIVII